MEDNSLIHNYLFSSQKNASDKEAILTLYREYLKGANCPVGLINMFINMFSNVLDMEDIESKILAVSCFADAQGYYDIQKEKSVTSEKL